MYQLGDTFMSEDLDFISELSDMEKKYCQIKVLQNPKSNKEALRRAGSTANEKYLSKMAWEIEQKKPVQLYIQHLTGVVVEEAGLEIQEIINNARKGIELAFLNNKPRDAEPHNRLLAELGGFIRKADTATTVNVQQNAPAETFKGTDIEADFERLQNIIGIQDIT